MSRIAQRFANLKATNRKALIPYITAGDPVPSVTVPLMHALVKAGADILEIGVPFSDPMAEGPVIQRAMERALTHHVALHHVLAMVSEFRRQDTTTPIVLMGYLNPIEVMGYDKFAQAAAGSGVDGVLIVDMPPEEADELLAQTNKSKLDVIFLVSPTTTDDRIAHIAAKSSGFIYYVSLKGVTGAGHLDSAGVQERVRHIRKFATQLPVGVGFGISNAAVAQAISAVADAVVVGSALVKTLETNQQDSQAMLAAATELIKTMRQAMDAGPVVSRAAGV